MNRETLVRANKLMHKIESYEEDIDMAEGMKNMVSRGANIRLVVNNSVLYVTDTELQYCILDTLKVALKVYKMKAEDMLEEL